MNSDLVRKFRREVWSYYKESGRHDLPWRQTTDPYKILVSEVMLQQTQVSRVVEKYRSFLKKFPTVHTLAKAALSDVLREWSGLGYNRRGKYLHDAAKVIVGTYKGDMKEALDHPLPGVGPYTRAAVRTFAFNEPHEMIETNIRTVYIHHFFDFSPEKHQGEPLIRDAQILEVARLAGKGQDPRTWHWALMDYGAYLKRTGIRNNSLSAHYTKQSKFEGSLRQIRGTILRVLSDGSASQLLIHQKTSRGALDVDVSETQLQEALAGLERDGMIKKVKGKWRIG